MFGKNKNRLDPKMAFLFGLVSGIAILAIIVSLALVVISTRSNDKLASETANTDSKTNVNTNTNTNTTPTPAPSRPSSSAASIAGKVKNNPNAKIAVEMFDDFECSFCLKHTNTIAQMLDEYGDQIKLELKHYPLPFHDNAQKAAEAFECAKEQGKEWEMHDKIFEAQAARTMSVATWKAAAKELRFSAPQFDSCLDDGKYADKVSQDKAEGQKRGIRGTPATFVNGALVSGAVSYSTLKAEIEKNL